MRRSLERQAAWFAFGLTLPALLLIALVIIYPLLYALRLSLDVRSLPGATGAWGLARYAAVLHDPLFRVALRNTLEFTLLAVGCELLLGLALAFLLQRWDFRGKGLLRSFYLLPLMVSPAVAALEWTWLLNDQYGVVRYLFELVHLKAPLWLASPNWAMRSVALTDAWMATPFVMLVFQAALQSLPAEPYEAARIDGASGWLLFRYITLPYLQPAILVVLLIRTMDALRVFDLVYIMTGGGPGFRTETLTSYTFKVGFGFMQMEKGAAMSFLTLALIISVSLLYLWFIRRKD